MTKTCPKCHAQLPEAGSVCTRCGNRVTPIEARDPRYCAAGKHPMDPAWLACPYCSDPDVSAQQAADHVEKRETDDETQWRPKERRDQPRSSPRKPTEFKAAAPESASSQGSQWAGQQNAGRRMAAVLVTYSWRPEGQMFPVYEGRNYIGKDSECEVRLLADRTLSGKHAAIFYRAGSFIITDEKSMNGTFVNGVESPLTGMPLASYDEIRTGATIWRFITIEPPAMKGVE